MIGYIAIILSFLAVIALYVLSKMNIKLSRFFGFVSVVICVVAIAFSVKVCVDDRRNTENEKQTVVEQKKDEAELKNPSSESSDDAAASEVPAEE